LYAHINNKRKMKKKKKQRLVPGDVSISMMDCTGDSYQEMSSSGVLGMIIENQI
jgi:hypothetical protein